MIVLTAILILFIIAILSIIFMIQSILYLLRKSAFPKGIFISLIINLCLFSAIYIYHNYYFTFEHINHANLQPGLSAITSPDGTYSAQVFYEPYGGAAGGVNVIVELIQHEKNNNKKVIYYSDAKTMVLLQWIDDITLSIYNDDPTFENSNRSIILNVEKEIYHEVGLACQSVLLKHTYKVCYQES